MRGGNLGRGAGGAIGSLTGTSVGITGLCYFRRATKEMRMATIPNMAPATVPTVFHTTMLLVQAWRLSPSIGCLFLLRGPTIRLLSGRRALGLLSLAHESDSVPAAYTISPPPLLTVVTPPRPSLEQQASLTVLV